MLGATASSASMASDAPSLEDTLLQLKLSYSVVHDYDVRVAIYSLESPDAQPSVNSSLVEQKVAKASKDRRVLIDFTDPTQAAVLGIRAGSIHSDTTIVSFSAGSLAVRQEVGSGIALGMAAPFAPSCLYELVEFWSSKESKAECTTNNGRIEIKCPNSRRVFAIDPAHWSVVFWSVSDDDSVQSFSVESSERTRFFSADFPIAVRMVLTDLKRPAGTVTQYMTFDRPTASHLTVAQTKWWSYGSLAKDLRGSMYFGPGDVVLDPASVSLPKAVPVTAGVDAMVPTKTSSGTFEPSRDNRLRNYLTLGGSVLCIVGIIGRALHHFMVRRRWFGRR